jgi:L-arabinonolactonase
VSAPAHVECVVPTPSLVGECPLWSVLERRLYWEDIEGRVVHRYDPVSGIDEVRGVPGRPGSMVLTSTPGLLLIGSEREVGWFEFETAHWEPWIRLDEPDGTVRLNDGRAGPDGRYWVGSMHEDTSLRRSVGSLHRVDADGSTDTLRDAIGCSNGLAFSPDGRTMYHADTFTRTVWAYDYDVDTGCATHRRVFTDFAQLPGRPDGACVDSDGCYWVACVFGSAVARLTPAGDVDRIVELPVTAPTMPAFGGDDLGTLYVTSLGVPDITGGDGMAGALFALDPGVTGMPEPLFAGRRVTSAAG